MMTLGWKKGVFFISTIIPGGISARCFNLIDAEVLEINYGLTANICVTIGIKDHDPRL